MKEIKGFWSKLKRPIFCLAPMADVTDCAFRQIIAKHGKPDVFYTEFVSADGLAHMATAKGLAHPEARKKLLIDLKYGKNEHPIVAQIFGAKIENIKIASALCKKLGFDGIDINMGCPDRSVEKQGAGAALIKNPKLAKEIIRAAKEGGRGLPISVKTRLGYSKTEEMEKWMRELLSEDLAALIVHLRTRKEMSNVPAHWELMRQIVKIRDEMKKDTLIIGNGDILNLEDAKQKIKETGCDGVMLGKAIFGNPFLFAKQKRPELAEGLKIMIEHTKLFEKLLMHPAKGGSASGGKSFAIMKKHYKAYIHNALSASAQDGSASGGKELRMELMSAQNAKEVEKITNDFLSKIE